MGQHRVLVVAMIVAMSSAARAAPAPVPDVPPAEAVDASAPVIDPADPALADPPRRKYWRAHDGDGPSLLVPILEVPAINAVFWGIDKAAGADFANLSLAVWKQHLLHGPWEWDHDIFFLNEFGHPYQGALTFTAARSSGLGFWASIPFAVAGSAMWETLGENEQPSKNDVIQTPAGGIMLGEVLHRTALLVLDEGGDKDSLGRQLLADAIEPVGGVNRYVFGRRRGDFFHRPPYYAAFRLGANFNVNNYQTVDGVHEDEYEGPQAHVALNLVYGMPGDPDWVYRRPFDHFVLSGELGVSRDFYGEFFIRGLIFGRGYELGQAHGLWGVFTGYDFASPNVLRVATLSAGLGSSAQIPMGREVYLVPTLIVSGVPLGAGGAAAHPTDDFNYNFGYGAQGLAELAVVRRGVGRMAATERLYFINGDYAGGGTARTEYLALFAELMLTARQGLGLEGLLADNIDTFGDAHGSTHQRATELRVYWTVMTGDGFGALTGPAVGPAE